MGRRRLIIAACAISLLAVVLFAVLGIRRGVPIYQGRTARQWLIAPGTSAGSPGVRMPGSSTVRMVVVRSNGFLKTNLVVMTGAGGFGNVDAFQAIGKDGWEFLATTINRDELWPGKLYRKTYAGPLRKFHRYLPDPGPPVESVRIRAMEIMAELRPQPTNLVTALYAALFDKNRVIRENAYRHLLRSRPPARALAAEVRKRPLQTLPSDMAFGICNVLKPDFDLVRTFIEQALSDDDPHQRESGLVALQSCARDPEPVVRFATAALTDPDYNVRYRAVYVLLDEGNIAAAALPQLRRTLEDESVIVRNASRKAIRAISGNALEEIAAGSGSSHP